MNVAANCFCTSRLCVQLSGCSAQPVPAAGSSVVGRQQPQAAQAVTAGAERAAHNCYCFSAVSHLRCPCWLVGLGKELPASGEMRWKLWAEPRMGRSLDPKTAPSGSANRIIWG